MAAGRSRSPTPSSRSRLLLTAARYGRSCRPSEFSLASRAPSSSIAVRSIESAELDRDASVRPGGRHPPANGFHGHIIAPQPTALWLLLLARPRSLPQSRTLAACAYFCFGAAYHLPAYLSPRFPAHAYRPRQPKKQCGGSAATGLDGACSHAAQPRRAR